MCAWRHILQIHSCACLLSEVLDMTNAPLVNCKHQYVTLTMVHVCCPLHQSVRRLVLQEEQYGRLFTCLWCRCPPVKKEWRTISFVSDVEHLVEGDYMVRQPNIWPLCFHPLLESYFCWHKKVKIQKAFMQFCEHNVSSNVKVNLTGLH